MMETAPCDDLTPDISHHTTDLGGSIVQRETWSWDIELEDSWLETETQTQLWSCLAQNTISLFFNKKGNGNLPSFSFFYDKAVDIYYYSHF